MVQAIISISDESNNVLNIVKAKYNLKDKSEAIDIVVSQYRDKVLEPNLRPEYISRAFSISREKSIKIGPATSLKKRYGVLPANKADTRCETRKARTKE